MRNKKVRRVMKVLTEWGRLRINRGGGGGGRKVKRWWEKAERSGFGGGGEGWYWREEVDGGQEIVR